MSLTLACLLLTLALHTGDSYYWCRMGCRMERVDGIYWFGFVGNIGIEESPVVWVSTSNAKMEQINVVGTSSVSFTPI